MELDQEGQDIKLGQEEFGNMVKMSSDTGFNTLARVPKAVVIDCWNGPQKLEESMY